MERLLDNWQQRTSLEKIIMAIVGLVIVCSLFYFLVFDPIINLREQQQKHLKAKEITLMEVTRLVSRFQTQSAVVDTPNTGLASIVDRSLQKNDLPMKGFQPGKNNDARLRLSNVAYKPLVQWLYELEYKHNISIEELTISQAKTPGRLMVSIRIVKS
ncbi:hypothetical protein AB835_03105 [Candidatus Endobugula sertula]|uniref:Type II secretion system protein M n=1 Tax=Candidatus Endobugula sertula TaxID=62101 RepID=A0A1D2QSQ1_9GAMM|nr:hypothetical protein AB835_03105 [Candidatus Endobugula sertula]